jgi:non-specific serine/threonine protein kinase
MTDPRPESTPPQSDVASLPAGSAVGSFVLRSAYAGDEFGRCYLASASASDNEVTIEEYLPEAIARRDIDGTLGPRSTAHAALWAEGLHAFVQEAEQVSRLDHPALLRLGPVWQARGTAYRLRSGDEGRPLASLVDAMTEPPSEAWLRALLDPLLGALQAVHEAGWVHGNVRPGQIVVRADGSPVLLDSGAVRGAIGARLPGGSGEWPQAGFLAPELLDARPDGPIGPWSDLHALAQVMRYCMTGQAPLSPDLSAPGAAEARATLGPRSLHARYSAGLVAALERALALNPQERPQSVAEFRHVMEAPPALRAVPAGPPARAQPLQTEARREAAALPREAMPQLAPTLQFTHPATRDRAAPLEPAWAPAQTPIRQDDRFDPHVFALHGATEEDVRAASADRRAGAGFRRTRRWPWVMGGMLAGAMLTGVLVFIGMGPAAEVQFAFSLPGGGDAAQRTPSAVTERDSAFAPPSPAASGVLSGTPLPPEPATGGGLAPVAPTATPAAPGAGGEPSVPASVVRQANTQQRAATPQVPVTTVAPGAGTAAAGPSQDGAAQQERSPSGQPRSAAESLADADAAAADGDRSAAFGTPAAACAPRSNFALYRCMQTQCEQSRFYTHPQCIRLRVRDELP